MKIKEAVTEYVTMKQSMGMRFENEAKILKWFCRKFEDCDFKNVDPEGVQAFLTGLDPAPVSGTRGTERSGAFIGLRCIEIM